MQRSGIRGKAGGIVSTRITLALHPGYVCLCFRRSRVGGNPVKSSLRIPAFTGITNKLEFPLHHLDYCVTVVTHLEWVWVMNRLSRCAAFVVLLALPALAFARSPLIYHQVANLPAHPGGAVRLVLSSHDVVVKIRSGDTVTVTTDIWAATDSRKEKSRIIERYAPKVSASGDDVVVRSLRHRGWNSGFDWGEGPQARVTVVMPPAMALDYRLGSGDFHFDNVGATTAIKGESGSGDVFVVSASKRLDLRAGSGDMNAKIDNGSAVAALQTGSGDIHFAGTTGTLNLEAGSGDITVSGGTAKSISITTGSGDVVTHWLKLAAGAMINDSAGSGDVVMYFPAGTVIGGRISTGSGDVDTDFPATIHGRHHTYTLAGGTGAVQVNLDTGSGDVALRKDD